MLLDMTWHPELKEDARWPFAVALLCRDIAPYAQVPWANFEPINPAPQGLHKIVILPLRDLIADPTRNVVSVRTPHIIRGEGGGEPFTARLIIDIHRMGDDSFTARTEVQVLINEDQDAWSSIHKSVTRIDPIRPPEPVSEPEPEPWQGDIWSLLRERHR